MSELSGDPWAPQPRPAAGAEGAEAAGGADLMKSRGDGGEPGDAEPRASRFAARQQLRDWIGGLGRRPHTPQEAWRFSWMVAGAVGLAYWFTQWPLPNLLSSHPDFNYYLVQPLVWGGVALLAGYGWLRLQDRLRFSRVLVGIAFLVGVFHVAVLVIGGVVWDFGDSPIAGRLVNYPKNLWYISTLLAGAEVARAYLFHVWRRRSRRLAFLATAVIFFALATPAAQWTAFDTVQRGFEMVGGRWLPTIALSILCTWLVSYGGIGPSFAYRLALLA